MTLKKGDAAKYDGVLIPGLNYKNYKTFEKTSDQMQKLAAVEAVQSQSSTFFNAVLWFVVGAAAGALAISVSK